MNNIKKAREAAGVTQQFVALSLGVKGSSVSNWESGKTRPSTKNLAALAKLLGVSADQLLDEDDFHPRSQSAPLLMLDGGDAKNWPEDELDAEMKRVFSSAPDHIKRASIDFVKFQLRNNDK